VAGNKRGPATPDLTARKRIVITTPRVLSFAVMLVVFATEWTVYPLPTGASDKPKLMNTCLITNDVKRLV